MRDIYTDRTVGWGDFIYINYVLFLRFLLGESDIF